MFQDLDATLTTLFADSAAPLDLQNADVSFEPPNKSFAPANPTINLFLYEVKENRLLRDPVPIVTRVGDTFVRRTPPLRVDCTYLVTTWSNQTGATGVAEEHLLLGLALAWLSRFPLIPTGFLQGSLLGQPFPLQTFVAQTEDGKSAGEFWSALGSVPRPAFHLLVTIALDLGLADVPEGPPVITRELGSEQLGLPATHESAFSITGIVTEAGAPPTPPIPNALVTILENGRTATADAEGVFNFALLEGGSYTLRTEAGGFVTFDKTITVPAMALNEYDIQLSP
jgi:hypothetical protein